MQVTETLAEGLKRELKIVVPAADMTSQMNEKLAEAKGKMQIKGFRPGKVPISHLKKVYGKSIMAQLVNEMIQEKPASILAERGERSATQPEISMTEDEKEADQILSGAADFEFTMSYEVIPSFDVADLSGVKVVREVVEVPAEEVEEQVLRVAENSRSFEPKKGKAADGDKVTIDYLGKVDGEPLKAARIRMRNWSSARTVSFRVSKSSWSASRKATRRSSPSRSRRTTRPLTLPARKPPSTSRSRPLPLRANWRSMTNLPRPWASSRLTSCAKSCKSQIEDQYGQVTRQKLKRQILDQLDEAHKFDTPSKLVDAEFESIWRQINQELSDNGKTFADEDTTEEAAREEYRALAERRVRLGLVLSKIGEEAGVEVSDEELQRSLFEQVRRFPGQEQEIYEYFQKTPGAVASLRAPIFEEKTIDHLMTVIDVTDKTVTKDELMAEDEAEASEKPAAKKKAPAKKKAAKKDEAASE
jgi:trigger factor